MHPMLDLFLKVFRMHVKLICNLYALLCWQNFIFVKVSITPPQLSDVHLEEQMPLEELIVGEDLTYQEYPVKILDTLEKVTRNNRYKMCKVQWSNHTKEEATWEKEDQLKEEFSDIFSNLSESRG
jgi:hypothetical protein